ncbi:lactate dehydrogenase [Alicyclobacillus acidoterrestris]|uniref:Ldh family oxidoreductase n=1 Tax=Alicyclobacillus suci TaxID=2816080 RepID=UPI001195B5D1|nr:Ldh family oxidoreductase [Alicyclobacillus suci]GEO24255.1 lactate dehydrogenase [Alicyclobacillus acidoterrestris]
MDEQRFNVQWLTDMATYCFEKVGVPRDDAAWAAFALVKADLLGRSTHGLSRLSAYIAAIEKKKINPRPHITLQHTGASAVVVDGDNGLGAVIAKRAMEAAMMAAGKTGVAVATVRHGNHAGAMSIYTSMAADQGMIGFAFSNAQPAIPPWGGRQAYFGTNPIAMAAGCDEHQISVDMATSVTARGNIIMAAKRGDAIPEGWALDQHGLPTTDANAALAGAVLPMAGVKGYALALLVEVLSGVLSGAAIGDSVGSIYDERDEAADTGMCFVVIHPEFFVGVNQFHSRLRAMEDDIRSIPLADGFSEILLPGQRSWSRMQEGKKLGLSLARETSLELESLCTRLGFPWCLANSKDENDVSTGV